MEAKLVEAFVGNEDDLDTVKRKIPILVETKGWDHVRKAATTTMRAWHTNGIFLEISGPSMMEKRLKILKWAAELAAWLPAQYPDVPSHRMGNSFKPTVERAFLCCYGETLIEACLLLSSFAIIDRPSRHIGN